MTDRARRHPGEAASLAGPGAEKTVSLALQGGGAYGAFTWGVLDAHPRRRVVDQPDADAAGTPPGSF